MTDESNQAQTPSADGDTEMKADSNIAPVWKRIVSPMIAVFAIIAILLTLVVTWEKAILQNEDQFVSTLADLPSNDAVATILSVNVADRIIERAGVNDFVVDALPDPLDFLATPLTATLTDAIAGATYEVVTSDSFTTVWETTLRLTHRSARAMLSGNDSALVSEDGTVAIDLNVIAGLAVTRIENRGITLPNLDIEFGEIVLYQSDQLATAQSIASALDTAGWLIPLIALLLIAASLWTAPDRRWTVAFLGFGTALTLLIVLSLHRMGRSAVLGGIRDDISREAGRFAWDAVVEVLVQAAWALIVLSLIIGFVAWVVGPSRHAKALSGWTMHTIEGWGRPEGAEPTSVGTFFSQWKRAIEFGVVIFAALSLLLGPAPTAVSVLITAIFAGVAIGATEFAAGPSHTTIDDTIDIDA
jgi:hypothetical protein